MSEVDLAVRLKRAGLRWTPANGDRFHVPDRDLDDEVFVISDLVVEVRDLPTGRLLAFNGTTEWALDSIEADEVVWLPREDQLRRLLSGAFVSLEAVPHGFVVTVRGPDGTPVRHVDLAAETALARAVLATLPQGR
ncbi:pilus assembly protein CpaE [Nocardioidaceae bacterium]|nr:pilus assembly protein CpaE [Nocardioidaceae bacterium]